MLESLLSSAFTRDMVVDVAFVNILTGAIMDAIPTPAKPGNKPKRNALAKDWEAWRVEVKRHKVATGRRKLAGKAVGLLVAGVGGLALAYLPEQAKAVFTVAVLAKWLGMTGHISAGSVLKLLGLKAKDPDPEESGLDSPPA